MSVVVIAALAAVTAGGCDDRPEPCHPGDTQGSNGQVWKCGTDGKWHL